MKRFFPAVAGNSENRRRIGAAVMAGTLSHAYILEGPEGSGKLFFATQIAAALACENRSEPAHPLPCGVCPHCRRILSGGAPDVRCIAPAGATIGVDAIRELKQDMFLSSTEESHKVYIIERAEKMTVQAQNALLVALEEPPTESVILLCTEKADALLTTVRSRAQMLRIRLLSVAEMRDALAENSAAEVLRRHAPEQFDAMLEGAGGCLGRALEQLDDKVRAARQKERGLVEKAAELLVGAGNFSDKLSFMKEFSTVRRELSEQLTLLLAALRDLTLLSRAEDAPLLFYTERAQALALTEEAGLPRLLALTDAVRRAQDALEHNANVQLTLLSLFTE